MKQSLSMPDLWEAFLQSDGVLTLKIVSYDSANLIKKGMSNYKSRVLARDKRLAEELGSFSFTFKLEAITEGEDKGKWILEIGSQEANKSKGFEAVEIVKQDELGEGI